MNLTKFAERLSELLFDARLNAPALAKILNCGSNTVTRYLQGNTAPSLSHAIGIADCFNCSVDYLLGLAPYENTAHFKECPPFSERIDYLCGYYKISKYRFQKMTRLPESAIYNWKSGRTSPSVESIIKIAETFDCRIDFVLGRE